MIRIVTALGFGVGVLWAGCSTEPTVTDEADPVRDPAPAVGAISPHATCGPTPYLTSVTLTDLNGNAVISLHANTGYNLKVSGNVAAFCATLTGGGQPTSGFNPSCLDLGSGQTRNVAVTSGGNPGCALTGYVTPNDACDISHPEANWNFHLPASGASCVTTTTRHYICGYALPGWACDNGRGHADVYATDLNAAITACHAAQPADLPDFCYVADGDGGTVSDVTQCTAASESWRPSSCCNFNGTVSCPQVANRHYVCGYALPGYGCNNGRGHADVYAGDLTAAIAACRAAQPANLPDFCYVADGDGATATDGPECTAASESWRPGSSCCNFNGTVSCPN